jgi:hypothetical protein
LAHTATEGDASGLLGAARFVESFSDLQIGKVGNLVASNQLAILGKNLPRKI